MSRNKLLRVGTVSAVLAALVLVACSDSREPAATSTNTSAATRQPRLVVDEQQLQRRLDEFVATTASPVLAVSVERPNKPRLVLLADDGGPGGGARRDTRFRIGSVSKVFIGALVLTLVRDGKLALDDVLMDYEPDFTGADRITIAELLHHTSGLAPQGGEADGPYRDAWGQFTGARLTREVSSDEVMDFVRSRPLLFDPGTNVQYSNVNTILLGRVAERLTNQPLAQALRERVLDPLGLEDTALWPNDRDAASPDPGVVLVNGQAFTTEQIPVLGTLSAIGAAGSVVSTVDDLAAFGAAYLRDRELLTDEIADDAFTINDFGTGAGVLGFTPDGPCVLRPDGCPPEAPFRAIGGVGNVPGGSAVVLYNPSAGVVVTVLANREGAPTDQLASVIMDNILGGTRNARFG